MRFATFFLLMLLPCTGIWSKSDKNPENCLRLKSAAIVLGPAISFSELFENGMELTGDMDCRNLAAISNQAAVIALRKAGYEVSTVTGSYCSLFRVSLNCLEKEVSNRLLAMGRDSSYSLEKLQLNKPSIVLSVTVIPETAACEVLALLAEWNGGSLETNSRSWSLPVSSVSRPVESDESETKTSCRKINASMGELVYRKGALEIRTRVRIIRTEADGWNLVENTQSGKVLRARSETNDTPNPGRN